MSIGSLDDVSFGAADRGSSAPSFLLRSSVHRREVESLQFETTRRPIVGSGALLLGGSVAGLILVAALGAYLVVVDGPPKLSAAPTHSELAAARETHETAVPMSTSVKADSGEGRMEAPSQTSVSESAAQGDPDAPRMVRTERFEGDPSAWVGVRKFSPLPAEEVPVLEEAPTVQPPTTAPAVPDSRSGVGPLRNERARAQEPRRHHRGRTHIRVQPAQMRTDEGAPSDVGGTQMTGADLRRDGSNNPVVSALSSVFGPR